VLLELVSVIGLASTLCSFALTAVTAQKKSAFWAGSALFGQVWVNVLFPSRPTARK